MTYLGYNHFVIVVYLNVLIQQNIILKLRVYYKRKSLTLEIDMCNSLFWHLSMWETNYTGNKNTAHFENNFKKSNTNVC